MRTLLLLLLSLCLTGYSYGDDNVVKYDPVKMYNEAVKCSALTRNANTIESAIRYSLYKEATKIVGLYELSLDPEKFIELSNYTFKKASEELTQLSGQERLDYFHTVCEGVVKQKMLTFRKEANKYNAMPLIRYYLDTIKIF